MKFIKEITPKGLLLPVTAAWLAGLGPGEKVEYRVQKGAMVVLKGRMTAMELLTAARTLHDLSVELNSHLAKVCGQCDGCGGDGEDGEPGCPLVDLDDADVTLPDYLRHAGGAADRRGYRLWELISPTCTAIHGQRPSASESSSGMMTASITTSAARAPLSRPSVTISAKQTGA